MRQMRQVAYLEVVDQMVGQLLRRLADANGNCSGYTNGAPMAGQAGEENAAAADRCSKSAPTAFAVCVTGDHSTPVVFGDHSHEPVPLTIAHIANVVSDMNLPGSSQNSAFSAILCWR